MGLARWPGVRPLSQVLVRVGVGVGAITVSVMSSVVERAHELLGVAGFASLAGAERVCCLDLVPPPHSQYVLRCPVVFDHSKLAVPVCLEWCRPLLECARRHQTRVLGVSQPFVYVTVRHGFVCSVTDDEWHVDGFSMRVAHVPEQNYVWCSGPSTEVAELGVGLPAGFDPLTHNIQFFFADVLRSSPAVVSRLAERTVYVLDPYVIHRRPPLPAGTWRTFVRVSCTPIPIDDVNNAVNPLFGDVTPDRDGVVEFRDQLLRFELPVGL